MHFNCVQCKQKGFAPILIILGIVLLLGVAGGVYYLGTIKSKTVSTPVSKQNISQPTQTVQQALKTFTDPTYKYSFKYPNTWSVDQNNQQFQTWDRVVDIFSSLDTSKPTDVLGQIYIWKPTVTLAGKSKKIDIQTFLEKPPVGGFKEITISGYKAYRAEEIKDKETNITVFFEKDSQVFQLIFTISEGQQKEANKVISEEILQSFRFD